MERSVLPKKGKLSAKDKKREFHPEFIRAKRKHSAVESDINALEANGLDKCPDKGIDGYVPDNGCSAVVGLTCDLLSHAKIRRMPFFKLCDRNYVLYTSTLPQMW